MVVERNSTHQ